MFSASGLDGSDVVLLAAGSGPDVSGWFLAIDGATATKPAIEELDKINSSGMLTIGPRLYRVLSSPSEPDASGDLLIYDETGVIGYRRVDGLADSHALVWTGKHLAIPCSATNQIFWLTLAGETARVWTADGDRDAWHINGLHMRDGRLYASAFGKQTRHRGWTADLGERAGIIFDVETQEPVVSDLACPHDPYFLDGAWMVCDSYTKRLLHVDEAGGTVLREAQLTGWTRSVAVSRTHIFVGVSGERHGEGGRSGAAITVLDRSTWEIVREIPMPCEELNALHLAPRSILPGLRRGFRTNALRAQVQDRRDLIERVGNVEKMLDVTPMNALERPQDRRIRLRVRAPKTVSLASHFDIHIELRNRGQRTLFSAPPYPINVGIIFSSNGKNGRTTEERRAALPEPLLPGSVVRFTLSVRRPLEPGTYDAKITLVQEWLRWFDEDAPANAAHLRFTVPVPSVERVLSPR